MVGNIKITFGKFIPTSHSEYTVHFYFIIQYFRFILLTSRCNLIFLSPVTLIVILQYFGYYHPASWELPVTVFNLIMPIVYSC